jgi:glycosyltransferase involved in cell wall biosynthesis
VIEAAALGLPVVAVAEGGPTVTVRDGETGLLVPAAPAPLAAAISRLAADPALRARMGRAAAAPIAATNRWADGAAVFLAELRAARKTLKRKA